MSEDFEKPARTPRRYRLTHLGNLNQVTKALAKTLRAMSNGELDSQVGARICNGLGIMRMCFETLKLDELGVRMDEISKRMVSKRLVDMRGRLMAEQSGSSPPLSVDYHETNGSSH